MNGNPFAILETGSDLSHAYLCIGDFADHKIGFETALKNRGLSLNTPGHFIFIGNTFGRSDADDLVAWYQHGATADSPHTIAVIAAGTLKTDAQQLLLKIFEEAREPYVFFLFAPAGMQIIETIRSRATLIELGQIISPLGSEFIKMPIGKRIEHVATATKNMESHEVRTYTESLVRDLIHNIHSDGVLKNKALLEKLLHAQDSLTTGHIAPKFILDYVITVLS